MALVDIGNWNKLKVIKHVDFGVYLDGDEDGEILLPLRYMPEQCDVGDEIDVFICYDSEDRLMATTEEPFATVGSFAVLEVVAIEKVGAFLDWGLPKDLFLPYAEQTRELKVGHYIVVYVYLDKSDRISASMRLERNLQKEMDAYEPGQAVELLIVGKTDLGYKAIINGKYMGVLFENEVFQELRYGQRTQGFIKKVREDGKIDLSLAKELKTGHKAADDITPQILALLEKEGGFLALTDKTPPETIYKLFGASKKKFKIALGGLYKKRLIQVETDGIRLIPVAKKKD